MNVAKLYVNAFGQKTHTTTKQKANITILARAGY